jgi:cellulose biosynthesis protein BcsQ
VSVICFSSLKGGVGKTSLSINVAHAYAKLGCQTLVIDLDPASHATRLLSNGKYGTYAGLNGSALAQLLLAKDLPLDRTEKISLLDMASTEAIPFIVQAREGVDLIPAGQELRHFLWGRGSRVFKQYFSMFIEELSENYDYIIFDTAPDFNVLSRNAIAVSDLVAVPLDSSEMSIHCLEELVNSSSHIKGPAWCIVRTMVSRVASRIQRLSNTRLSEKIEYNSVLSTEIENEEDESSGFDEDELLSAIRKRETIEDTQTQVNGSGSSPIFLLDSVVNRTEQHNRLSFEKKTAFDFKDTQKLADQYIAIVSELERLLSIGEVEEEESSEQNFFELPANVA